MLESIETQLQKLESNNPTVETLVLRQKIDSATLNRISTILEQNPYLRTLDLENCNLGDEGTKIIAKALEKNKGLRTLFLTSNKIGDEGAKALARMLKVNTSLQVLYMPSNNIGAEGARAIAEAISENYSLISLTISGNKIGDEGAKAIASEINKNTSLTQIYLGQNNIGKEGEAALTASFEKNTHLLILNFVDHNNCEYCEKRFEYSERNEKLKEKSQYEPFEVPTTTHDTIPGSSIDRTLELPLTILPKEIPDEVLKPKFLVSTLVVEKNQNAPTLREEKSAGFPWGKLALFLLGIGALGVGGLAIAGLFFSLWTIVPAVPLLIGIFFGIKAIYDKFHRPFQDRFKGTSLSPEPHIPWSDTKEPKNVNTQEQSFITGKKPSIVPIENSEAMQKAAKAKAIIIGKVNEFVNHVNEPTITNKYSEFSLKTIQDCCRYIESNLTIVEEEGSYVLCLDVIVPSEVIPKPPSEELSSALEALSSHVVNNKLILIIDVINSCLGRDSFAVCDRFSPQPRTRIKYPNAVFITSDSIDEIIHIYPDPIKTEPQSLTQ